MPVKERATFLELENVLTHNFTGDSSWSGSIIDTADYDMGISFMMYIFDDDGTTTKYTMSLEHGNNPNLSDAEAVPQNSLVFGRKTGILPWQLGNNTPGTPEAKLSTEGVVGIKRYIRVTITASNWDSTPSVPSAWVVALKNPEIIPTTQRLGSV